MLKAVSLRELLERRERIKREPIPEEELQSMAERCRKATTGPWVAVHGYTIGGPVCYMDEDEQLVVGTSGDWGPTSDPRDDAEFIAHARMDLPRVLIELMRLRGLDAPDLDDLQLGPMS